ncbi:Nuclear envelope pore membrane protein POM 121C [Manis javanica]|nr:Nuclear envelope pore membrane protein POM 121C [Manis javanica]
MAGPSAASTAVTPQSRCIAGPSRRACGTSPHHFGITRSRRYPIQQAQYSCALPTLCRNGHHRKRVLSPSNSSVVQAFDGEDRSSREQPGSFSNLWKRRPSASPFSSPASSSSQTPESPEKKMREEDGPQGSGSSAPPVNKESQGEQDTTTCREQNSWDSPPTPSSSQPRRRKFPLVPSRQGIPLILPRAAWIGCSIKVEEYYQEKQAQSQWLKRIFEDKTATTSDFEAMTQTTSSAYLRTRLCLQIKMAADHRTQDNIQTTSTPARTQRLAKGPSPWALEA